MEKLKRYGNIIADLLQNYKVSSLSADIEEHIITDFKSGHFQLLRTGWTNKSTFKMGILLHFQIKDNKIWILANWTEDDIAQALVDKGVKKEDIVLGFQPEYVRPYSGYAVA